jgi:hypothetical protein
MKHILTGIFVIVFFLSIFGQKSELHPYFRDGDYTYALKIKSMEENKALIFSIKNYNAPIQDDIGSVITKVDYCGSTDFFLDLNVPNFKNIMIVDGIYNKLNYILLGTAISTQDNNPYFITLQYDINLESPKLIDKKPIGFPFFSSFNYSLVQDEENDKYYFAFNTSNGPEIDNEAIFIIFDKIGKIEKLISLDLNDITIFDHYYNNVNKKHYIFSGSNIFVYDSNIQLENSYDIYVPIDGIDWYVNEGRILDADDNHITIIGRWGSTKNIFTYEITLEDKNFIPGDYKTDLFPYHSYYFLRKISTNTHSYISANTDILETDISVPNKSYFWQLDKSGVIKRTYNFGGDFKKSLNIHDIDSKNNMLGLGYEFAIDNNIFVILSPNNDFEVNAINSSIFENVFQIIPNPASDLISITGLDNLDGLQLHIIDHTGRHAMNQTIGATSSVDVSNLVAGLYFVSIIDDHGRQIGTTQKLVKM